MTNNKELSPWQVYPSVPYSDYWKSLFKDPRILILGIAFIMTHVVFYWTYQYKTPFFLAISEEDGFFEYATFFLYAGAAAVLVIKLKSCTQLLQRLWLVTMAFCFFFIAGEEISWGQRLFDYNVPSVERISTQSEFNVHNLEVLSVLKPWRVLSIGTLLFGVALPIALLIRPISTFVRNSIAFPVPHPVLSVCFLSSYIWYASFHPNSEFPLSIEETREATIALGFFVYALMVGHDIKAA